MKTPREVLTDENRRVVRAQNRPDLIRRDEGVLFHNTGSTGWGRIRRLGDYEGNKSERNFNHLNHKFWEEGDESV
jgi:hypothetical protein